MRKKLREEILSINIKKDNTYDEILDIIDDYCRKNHKNTSIRFALGFYYLFLAKVYREAENYDEDLHMILDIFKLLAKNKRYGHVSDVYADTFLHIINMYIDPIGWWARRLGGGKYIMYHIALPHIKIAIALCNAGIGCDKYIDKDGDILFISERFRNCGYLYDKIHTSSAAINRMLPALVF